MRQARDARPAQSPAKELYNTPQNAKACGLKQVDLITTLLWSGLKGEAIHLLWTGPGNNFVMGAPSSANASQERSANLRVHCRRLKLNIDLVGLYAAGAQVINDWDNYSCFSDT
jgi:hypothetical protein